MLASGDPIAARINGRRDAAHSAVDKVYDSIRQKIELLREKRQLQGYVFVKIQKKRIQYQEHMRRIAQMHEHLQEERQWLNDALQSRWMKAAEAMAASGDSIRLNVGGHTFRTTVAVLRRSGKGSRLWECIEYSRTYHDTPFFIARDWWLFRHVLQFLRDGDSALPRSKSLLKQLYYEARYFKCEPLRTAVRLAYQRIAAAEAELPSLPPTSLTSVGLPGWMGTGTGARGGAGSAVPVTVSEAGMAAAVAAASGLPPPGGAPGYAFAGGGPWSGLVGAPTGGGFAAGSVGGVLGGAARGWGLEERGSRGHPQVGYGQFGLGGMQMQVAQPASAVYPTPLARAAARQGAIAPLAPLDATIAAELGLSRLAYNPSGGATESKTQADLA